MFELLTPTEATLTSVTPRTEVHGENRVFAITLGVKITAPNTILDGLSATLRSTLYKPIDSQEQLPGVEESTPLLRTRGIDLVSLAGKLEGWTLTVDHGIDESNPITLGGCKVDHFKVEPSEGGTVALMFRIGSNDVDATEAGLLCSKLSQEIALTLKAPQKPADAIDGTTEAFRKDHPDATDLFSAGQDDPEGADSEGGDLDVEAGGDDGAPLDLEDRLDGALAKADGEDSWPFPKQPPQSVTTEVTTRSPAGSRTARGRQATAKALAAGANS